MSSPTQRTLERCRREGWRAAVVERWNPHARVRHDLFGFADLVVLDGGPGLLAIQATSGSNVSARCEKLSTEVADAVRAWLAAGLRCEVWGWRKVKVKRGGAATRWEVRRLRAFLDGELVGWDDV